MTALNINVGDRVLVTTNGWFYAPDGARYGAAFGTVRAIRTAQDTLGVAPQRPNTNWYLEVGNMTIAGCQVLYAVRPERCNFNRGRGWHVSDSGVLSEHDHPCAIYNADVEATA